MTIVTKNSLTISNVNDGTITHYAYANSADGTAGFTTVYPNLNLLNFKSGITWGKSLTWADGLSLETNPPRAVFDYVSVISGTTYTINSDWDKTERIAIYAYDSNDRKNATFIYDGSSAKWVSPNTIGRFITQKTTLSIPDGMNFIRVGFLAKDTSKAVTLRDMLDAKIKVEQGSIATTWMPSASEVKTSDWPSYIGQYTDFTQADSTNPSNYTWSLIRGNDGVGIKTSVITYAISISGTIAPTTGWTSSVPSLVKGLYLWTQTVWTYTDNSSETGYSVTYISKDGNNGNDGIAGKDGTGIKTTTITYAGSTSGTTAPTSGWTSAVPTVAAGSYLWTKTVWTYTDNTSETGYSVAKMGNNGATGPQGPQGNTGPQGPAGSNGDPGKIVSDAEPTAKFKGLTWKYSGMTAINASDGTSIQPSTEYYWNGNNWVLNQINAHNINVDELTSITSKLGDATAGSLTLAKGDTGGVSVKDGIVKSWDISKVTDPNYPDGYSYTSMGAALDSGGITFYSAGYGQKLNQEKVIDDKYKIATLSAVAGNGRQDGGVGLILDASNPNFPLNIIGNVRIQDTIDLGKVKSVEVPLGWGRSVILTRVGNQVTMFSNKTFSGTMNQGLWSQANEKIPNGYKPYGQVYIYSVSIVNQSKFMWYRLGPSGGVEIWQNGNITTSDTMITPVQSWITSDGFPS